MNFRDVVKKSFKIGGSETSHLWLIHDLREKVKELEEENEELREEIKNLERGEP